MKRQMAGPVRVGLIGDHDPSVLAHRAIPEALRLAFERTGRQGAWTWIHTSTIDDEPTEQLEGYAGLWCVPASPYASTRGALAAIRFARVRERPFLGTCGGFQHALLEHAAAVWAIERPAHAELDPGAPEPVISPLACALVEQRNRLRFAPDSRLAASYRAIEAVEGYHCRYGLNPAFADRLARGPLRATAWDDTGEVRAVELDEHPFFVGTLFQPERAALGGEAPPLVCSFVQAAAARASEA
jgi:CTP synthase (UTP-ammonia lyase)